MQEFSPQFIVAVPVPSELTVYEDPAASAIVHGEESVVPEDVPSPSVSLVPDTSEPFPSAISRTMEPAKSLLFVFRLHIYRPLKLAVLNPSAACVGVGLGTAVAVGTAVGFEERGVGVGFRVGVGFPLAFVPIA